MTETDSIWLVNVRCRSLLFFHDVVFSLTSKLLYFNCIKWKYNQYFAYIKSWRASANKEKTNKSLKSALVRLTHLTNVLLSGSKQEKESIHILFWTIIIIECHHILRIIQSASSVSGSTLNAFGNDLMSSIFFYRCLTIALSLLNLMRSAELKIKLWHFARSTEHGNRRNVPICLDTHQLRISINCSLNIDDKTKDREREGGKNKSKWKTRNTTKPRNQMKRNSKRTVRNQPSMQLILVLFGIFSLSLSLFLILCIYVGTFEIHTDLCAKDSVRFVAKCGFYVERLSEIWQRMKMSRRERQTKREKERRREESF